LTRYVVGLDVGGELVVVQQNLRTSSTEALRVQGRAVRLVWDPGFNRSVDRGGPKPGPEGPGEGER
jgi:hypothetical protein